MDSQPDLDDLTPHEVGRLFPVVVVPYDPHWIELFEEEKLTIVQALGKEIASSPEHIGSTSVPGLAAKPTIDILVEVDRLDEKIKSQLKERLAAIGYMNMRSVENEEKMTFGKGYDVRDPVKQTYHLHIRKKRGTPPDEIYFRDHLRANPEARDEYAILKTALAHKYRLNREEYTQAKSKFVERITRLQKEQESRP